MDIITQLGSLAIGSRLKRISDMFMKDVLDIYQQSGIDFHPKWFPLMFVLSQEKIGKGITELAENLGVSHPAIIQIAQEMEKAGWICSEKSGKDARKRLLKLTDNAKTQLPKLQEIWACLQATNDQLFDALSYPLLPLLDQLEMQYQQYDYQKKYKTMETTFAKPQVEIIAYDPQYLPDFKALNLEWINTYFEVETHDVEQLDNPQKYILNDGGAIYFARYQGKIIGTVALVKVSDTTYELAKMAVSPAYQGLKAGYLLGKHLIEEARKQGATFLFLESNQKLTPALTLYKKLGFVEVPIGETPYSRADFKAEMYL
jgi:GNAT superfamily N-acetyltransferase/DNA-binding MarR family transcriptional regulator